MKKPIIILYTVVITLSIFYFRSNGQSNTPKQSQKISSTDSTITFNEIIEFNAWLRDNISVNGYSKLTPEATLGELWNWKLRKISASKKVLSDSTKKK